MDTTTYKVNAVVTNFDGKQYLCHDYFAMCGTLPVAKDYIATTVANRNLWDDDGFCRELEFTVRYGDEQDHDPREYVVHYAFDENSRSFVPTRDYFRSFSQCEDCGGNFNLHNSNCN